MASKAQIGKQWRQQKQSAEPLTPPNVPIYYRERDQRCAGSWMQDTNGKFRTMKNHRCSEACTWTFAQAMEWLNATPIDLSRMRLSAA